MSSPRLLIAILAGHLPLLGACDSNVPDHDEPRVEQYVKVVPRDFFSGTWRLRGAEKSGGGALTTKIDLEAMKWTSIHESEHSIEDAIPVDGGYALLLSIQNDEQPPEEVHSILVIKRIGEDEFVMIEFLDTVSIFERMSK